MFHSSKKTSKDIVGYKSYLKTQLLKRFGLLEWGKDKSDPVIFFFPVIPCVCCLRDMDNKAVHEAQIQGKGQGI